MTLMQLKYAIEVSRAGSMNEAARNLFIAQPSLSAAIKELETELGIVIFRRTNRGITLTPDGEEFMSYARQVVEQYNIIELKYIDKETVKEKFSVSMQHYSFAVNAFINMINEFGMDRYEFAIHETKTAEVIEDVKNYRSELGILYLNEFNKNALGKLFVEYGLEFTEIMKCHIYVYMCKNHPLASKQVITMEDLDAYPCLSFEQGANSSLYYSEEVLSTHVYRRLIKVNDRATILNLMVGLNGFTLCSGIISEDLNGDNFCAVRLDSDEEMTIGYVARKGAAISKLGNKYIEEISKFIDKAM